MQHTVAVLMAATILLGTGCRSMSSPLRPGQEALTGGRAVLSQWEFYDALAQMYRAQVMLNVIRLVEYGEAPLHFEFSDITAKITDQASIGSGFTFFDSPAGGSAIGNVFVPTRDTNVTFTPSISASRKVDIQAKATPVVRNNWIYNWYYTIADQFTDYSRSSSEGRANERAFYKRISGATKLGTGFSENLKGRLSLWYRGDLYVIKEEYESDLEVDGFTLRRSPFPAEELGSLAAIVTFLQPSNPREASGADVKIPARFGRVDGPELPPDSDKKRLYITPKLEHPDPQQLAEIQKALHAVEIQLKPLVKNKQTALQAIKDELRPLAEKQKELQAIKDKLKPLEEKQRELEEAADKLQRLLEMQNELHLAEAKLVASSPVVTIQFPTKQGSNYYTRQYQFAEIDDDGTWEFLFRDDDPDGKDLNDAYDQYVSLPASPLKRVTILWTIRAQIGRISTTDAARHISGAPALPKTPDEKDLLESILTVLERNELRNNP